MKMVNFKLGELMINFKMIHVHLSQAVANKNASPQQESNP